MPTREEISIDQLFLDLENPRYPRQASEQDAVNMMINVDGDHFFGLMQKIIEEGYTHEGRAFVQEAEPGRYTVKEGNRRVACLKILHGLLLPGDGNFPAKLNGLIDQTHSDQWKEANGRVECLVYLNSENEQLKSALARTHTGDAASRDPWESVAKARFEFHELGKSVPEMELLEKFLQENKRTLVPAELETWSAKFPITVLGETLRKLPKFFEQPSKEALAKAYPNVSHRGKLDEIITAIGRGKIAYSTKMVGNTVEVIGIRDSDFASKVGLTDILSAQGATAGSAKSGGAGGSGTSQATSGGSGTEGSTAAAAGGAGGGKSPSTKSMGGDPKTVPTSDQQSVRRLIRGISPRGNDRTKIVDLLGELKKLEIKNTSKSTPYAFCFVVRAVFDVAAKQYCERHGISLKKQGSGDSKSLRALLAEIADHLKRAASDAAKKQIGNAKREIESSTSILGTESLNELIHGPDCHVKTGDICRSFLNIYPLLKRLCEEP